jgi:cytochrome c biogenesis protein CcmG/thiol:disulfide interchange protein DsbE
LTLLLFLAVPAVAWILRSALADQEVSPTVVEVGLTAPDFTLSLFDGATFTLSSHLAQDGRPVVLNFWASWCLPCRHEMPAFDAVAHDRPEIFILGVAVQDTEPAARAFADEVGVSYSLGYDTEGTILEKYPTLGLPATWFITADGTVAEQWFGQLDKALLEEMIERHQ